MYIFGLEGQEKIVYHDLMNKTFGREVPHEWYFINFLIKSEMKKDRTLASKFVIFVMQYYPDYEWLYLNLNDMTATVAIECNLHDMNFWKVFRGVEAKSITDKSLIFGSIVTDFLIRYCGYSLVGCNDHPILKTSQSDCDKRFWELLDYGYSVQRVAKIYFKETSAEIRKRFPWFIGTFHKLPILPTKECYVKFEEQIEGEDGRLHTLLYSPNSEDGREPFKKFSLSPLE